MSSGSSVAATPGSHNVISLHGKVDPYSYGIWGLAIADLADNGNVENITPTTPGLPLGIVWENAIDVLSAAKTPAKKPREHHLRVTYALADLYERAGDVPRARQLFGVVAAVDPDLGDVTARLRALR